jgi:hypothetical protein
MTSPSTPNTISGRSAFIELLLSEGVTHLFGNPGPTAIRRAGHAPMASAS